MKIVIEFMKWDNHWEACIRQVETKHGGMGCSIAGVGETMTEAQEDAMRVARVTNCAFRKLMEGE